MFTETRIVNAIYIAFLIPLPSYIYDCTCYNPLQSTFVMYRIYLIKRPGVYFIATSVEGAFKRDGRYSKRAFIVLSTSNSCSSAVIMLFWLLPQLSASILSRIRSGVSPSVSSLPNSILCCHCFSWFHVLIQLHPQCHAPYMGGII